MIPCSRPWATWKLTSCSACRPPNDRDSRRTSKSGAPLPPRGWGFGAASGAVPAAMTSALSLPMLNTEPGSIRPWCTSQSRMRQYNPSGASSTTRMIAMP